LKEAVHVAISHLPGYKWNRVVTKLFLACFFADSNKRLQFWEGTGLLMKEMMWYMEKDVVVILRIRSKV